MQYNYCLIQKNHRVLYLLPGGAYQLTPLYDVISAWPMVAHGTIHKKELKMAMSVAGKNKHYYWDEILKRHWLNTSHNARFPEGEFEDVSHELLDTMEDVISCVAVKLPGDFPGKLAEAVFDGMKNAKADFGKCDCVTSMNLGKVI